MVMNSFQKHSAESKETLAPSKAAKTNTLKVKKQCGKVSTVMKYKKI